MYIPIHYVTMYVCMFCDVSVLQYRQLYFHMYMYTHTHIVLYRSHIHCNNTATHIYTATTLHHTTYRSHIYIGVYVYRYIHVYAIYTYTHTHIYIYIYRSIHVYTYLLRYNVCVFCNVMLRSVFCNIDRFINMCIYTHIYIHR